MHVAVEAGSAHAHAHSDFDKHGAAAARPPGRAASLHCLAWKTLVQANPPLAPPNQPLEHQKFCWQSYWLPGARLTVYPVFYL